VYMFGKWVGNTRQGWSIWAAMFILFSMGYFVAVGAEQNGNVLIASRAHVATAASATQPGGNMEGKETRFGIAASALFVTVTTDASCGAVNAAHDSLTPLGGLVPLFNIELGEVVFGGTDPEEWWEGRRTLLQVFKAQMQEMAGFKFAGSEPRAYRNGSIGWVADRPRLQLPDGNEVPMRLTAVLQQQEGRWRLVQGHLSMGVRNEDALGKELTT